MEDPAFPIPKLPNDVIVEILTWLPVKPLLKFKSVCKSWRALISSPKFAKSHLQNSKLDRSFTTQRLLMRRILTLQNYGNFATLSHYKQVSANSMLNEPVSEAFDLSLPFQPDNVIEAVVGSCNGLLCLMEAFPIPGKADNYYRVQLNLWNPSTRIRKGLPHFELGGPSGDLGITKYGFGYDKSSDDYKVVRFFHGDMDSSESKVMLQVYSLRNDEWKTAKPSGMHSLETLDRATFVNGKLYWIGFPSDGDGPEDEHEENSFVVCFDLETEEYEILQLPKGMGFKHLWLLGECGGSLRLMCCHISRGSDVWSLAGSGVGNENWAKVVRLPCVEDALWYCEHVLYVMNSPVMFFACMRTAIFDAKDGSIRNHEIRNADGFTAIGEYIESLVSPLGW